uniref:Riboflavin kinase n=1 Tax=Eutreptiella gymnastica TaxID=73025 RepID=A0A7S1I9R4_9EUGL|mmetsp:Transcript_139868/g.243529  ORF Transcript_139868/g.243529 Transcript_139868/m.243529 type:complete len:173 (+) Transcript_139868:72-590(+)
MTPEEYLQRREAAQEALWPKSDWMPGVKRLLDHLHAHDIPTAVATSSHQKLFAQKTANHTEAFGRFKHIVCGDDPRVAKTKPAPDCFLLAAQLLGAAPEDCLVFEDAPNGVQAAKAAGMAVVWIPHSFMLKEEDVANGVPLEAQEVVNEVGATQTLPSMEAFCPQDWGLPPY